jgi:hypothetical protein
MTMKKSAPLLLLIFLLSVQAYSQFDLPLGFVKSYEAIVDDGFGNELINPWAGGLNACQFGEIDLNEDGIRDLVVFDRNGNRTLTWENQGMPGEISYIFNPSLADRLPHFDDWVIFADYNMDGLNDIFTYSKGFAGIKVYRNTGNPDEMFELVVFPYLKSFQGNGYVNVLVTYVDYPAISDLDNDGDLDMLTFWGLGSFVEFHLNESMELYGVPDSLIFRKTENCWGRFAESEESNVIYLDTCFDRSTLASGIISPDDSAVAIPPPSGGAGGGVLAISPPLGGAGGGAQAISPPSGGVGGGAYAVSPHSVGAGGGTQPGWVSDDFRHTGSTFLIFDSNGDGLDDLLLGDVDYPSPALLINGGTPRDALMTSHSFSFPDYDTPIDLLSFPVMSYLDVNNDGAKDLIVSSFDPSLVKSKNVDNNWLYINQGETDNPDFYLTNQSFLQDEMLDFGAGAVPVLFDHNNDGLLDIVVGNFGYLDSAYYGIGFNLMCDYRAQLALLENTGTISEPQFTLISRNYANLPDYFPEHKKPFAAVPTFGDLDGDGDKDMLVGNAEGTLLCFINIAPEGFPAEFQFTDQEYQSIDAGNYSAPQLFDLDNDGLLDLAVGKRNGTISFYRNTGSAQIPEFMLVTDSLGKVDVRDPNLSIFGYCVPHFYRDQAGEAHLFAGSEFGKIFYYNNIDGNLDGSFNLAMQNYLWIDEGLRNAIAIGNLNNDLYPDMIVGNYSGGLSYFAGTMPPPAGVEHSESPGLAEIRLYPNPATNFVYIDWLQSSDVKIIKISIMDFTGKEIQTIFDQQKQVDIREIKDGIFLLQIWMETSKGIKASTHKLIINR